MITLPRDKVIITCCVTGAFLTREMTPAAPLTPLEIIQATYDAYNAGASIVHIHARDHQGNPTGDRAIFQEIHAGIRERCDMVLQDSTGGGANLTLEERLDCLNAHPEMASLNMGTLLRVSGAYKGTPFSNPPWDIQAWAKRMQELGIKPEMEVYSHAMFRDVQALITEGLLEPRPRDGIPGRYRSNPPLAHVDDRFCPSRRSHQRHRCGCRSVAPHNHGHGDGNLYPSGYGRQYLLPQR
jgi:3-keto-5-aminohexanoate cleavage enzyme